VHSVFCAGTVQVLLTQILNQEPLIGESKRPALRQLLQRLVAKLLEPQHSQFDLFKVPHR
jgi:dynein assembly factor with WDR repeat domains 1